MRKGRPIEVDKQVILWRKRRRKAAQIAQARSEALTAVLSHFNEDVLSAQQWLSEARISPYNVSPKDLLKKGRTKAVMSELQKMQDAKNA